MKHFFSTFREILPKDQEKISFLVKDGALHTPLLGNVLNGITRKSVFQIAKDLGISVTERTIRPEEIWEADEAFLLEPLQKLLPLER